MAKHPLNSILPNQRTAFSVLFAIVAFVGLLLATWTLTNRPVQISDSSLSIVQPTFAILQTESMNAEDLVVTDENIRLAQAYLGDEGFIAVVSCNLESEYHTTLTREIR